MADEQNKAHVQDRSEDSFRPPSPSSDLLELVRSAEDEARLAIRKRTPAIPMQLATIADGVAGEEFVDVGDDAIDAPPSVPPLSESTPASARRPSPGRAGETVGPRFLPPVVGIGVLLALAVGALLVLAR